MKVLNWIELIDAGPSLKAKYYDTDFDDNDDSTMLWEGSLADTPYWIAKLELADAKELEGYPPIEWNNFNGDSSFIFYVKVE